MPEEIKLNTKEGMIKSTFRGKAVTAPYGWYRGEKMVFHPDKESLLELDDVFTNFIGSDILKEIKIDHDTNLTTFGSCFAAHISEWFSRKYPKKTETETYVIRFNEGFVNTFSVLQQFEWALDNKIPKSGLWFDDKGEVLEYDEKIRLKTKEVFTKTDLFVITLGLSEVWYDDETQEVFWRAVPRKHFDSNKHKFRLSKVDENFENLKKICDTIGNSNPNAKIIFTLSPVPLIASFRDSPIIQSNCISKSILRVSIDRLISEYKNNKVYYWPSFEIINTLFKDPNLNDCRHIKKEILDFNMALFDFCITDTLDFDKLAHYYKQARDVN
jgi:hypothetical protein